MLEEVPRIIYLSIIGFFCLSYVLYAYRGRLGTALQTALIWVLIFVAAITLYGFKDTFQQQVFSNHPTQVSENIIRLPRAYDGHFYADLLINGVRVEFIVDTGASDIVLSNRDAVRIGINLDKLVFFGMAETANGAVRTASVRLDTVTLANLTDHNLRASVTDGETGISLLGMAYLSRFSKIEILDDAMFLHK
ncbi:MAG: retropepsin-like aspartic protease family protein [Alphaproteobacteria bacterium]